MEPGAGGGKVEFRNVNVVYCRIIWFRILLRGRVTDHHLTSSSPSSPPPPLSSTSSARPRPPLTTASPTPAKTQIPSLTLSTLVSNFSTRTFLGVGWGGRGWAGVGGVLRLFLCIPSLLPSPLPSLLPSPHLPRNSLIPLCLRV
jgi:hypothetical protein